MNPVRYPLTIDVKPQRVVHRIGPVRPFDRIATGLMGPVRGGDAEFTGRRFIAAVAGRDGQRESQGTEFVCAEKLLGQVDQDELLRFLGRFIEQRQRRELGECVEAFGDFDRNTGHGMPPVDAIEPRNIGPLLAEQFLQRLAALEGPAFPLNGLVAGIAGRAGAPMAMRRIGERGRRGEHREEHRHGEKGMWKQPRHRLGQYQTRITDINSRRLFKKVAQQGRSEYKAGGVPLRYVEALSDARTPLAALFNNLLKTSTEKPSNTRTADPEIGRAHV